MKLNNNLLDKSFIKTTATTSETDVYSTNYVNEALDEKQDKWEYLYNGNGTNGNVPLSKNISNYSFIEIYAQKSGCYGSTKILAEPDLQFGLSIHNAYDTTDIQQIYGRYTLNSNGSQIVKDRELYMNNNGSPASSNDIYIMKVIGYK